MRLSALLVVLGVLVVGCGTESGSEGTAVVSATTPPAAATEPVPDAPATQDPPEAQDAPAAQDTPEAQDAPAGLAGLANCEDLPELGSTLEGKLSGRQNPDPIVRGVMATYAMEHPDTYGGLWIDRDRGGVLVMGFTDDPEPHRAAILARAPSSDDYAVVRPPPPITDERPLGERDDVVIDVVQVRFSELEVEAMRETLMGSIPREDWSDLGLDSSGYDLTRQRVSLSLVNPPDGALDEIAERVPDPSVLCVSVTRTPQPPAGPLDVIPDLDVEDPLVSCWGTPAVRYSQMIDPPSIDDIDHPAVDVLRAELDTAGGEPLPRGRWVVINIDEDVATFAAISDGGFGLADIERRGDRWTFSGHSAGPPCEPVIPLPPGLARVEVTFARGALPEPDDTAIRLLVTEWGCASGREIGDALRGPQVIETDDAVLVAFAVVPVAGGATCPGNPSTAVTVELSAPLGERVVYDGLHFPPKPLVTSADEASVAE